MTASTPRPIAPERLQDRFAVLSRINLIRVLLCVFAFYGIGWGTLLVIVGSFSGPQTLVAGILHVLLGAWCVVLAFVILRGGSIIYWCLLVTAASIVAIGILAVAGAILDSAAIAAVLIGIFLLLPVCLAALLASKSVRTWFLHDSR